MSNQENIYAPVMTTPPSLPYRTFAPVQPSLAPVIRPSPTFMPTLDPSKSINRITGNLVYSDIVYDKDGKNAHIDAPQLTRGKAGMLFIHASWCPHCVKFSPVYQSVCETLNKNGLLFPCLAIESSQITDNLGKALDFTGFPTIKFFDQSGKILPLEYEGERTKNGLLAGIQKFLSQLRDMRNRPAFPPTVPPQPQKNEENNVRIDGITANLSNLDFITDQNGQVFIRSSYAKGKPGLLFIHASWCPHCINFIPTYKSICSKLNNNGTVRFPCLAIESEQLKNNMKLAQALQVRGFPTIKFFDQNGKILGNYNGPREENSILQAIRGVCQECMRGVNF